MKISLLKKLRKKAKKMYTLHYENAVYYCYDKNSIIVSTNSSEELAIEDLLNKRRAYILDELNAIQSNRLTLKINNKLKHI